MNVFIFFFKREKPKLKARQVQKEEFGEIKTKEKNTGGRKIYPR